MTKTTFLAIDPTGTTHTRKSEHGYTHAVLARRSKEWAIDDANMRGVKWNTEHAAEQFKYAGWTVERFNEMLLKKGCGILARDNRYATESIAKAQAFVAQWGTVEAYVRHHLEADLAKIEAKDFTVWGVISFNSRRDLAEKEASKRRGQAWHAEVIIVNAMAR